MKTIAIKVLESLGTLLWGFKPNLMKDVVEMHGGVRSLVWFARNMPKYEKILKAWGAERTHLLIVAISGINGCPYCLYGHALSFQLHYYKNTGLLFPIDEFEMIEFTHKTEKEIILDLRIAYENTNLIQEKKDLERLICIKKNPNVVDTKDDDNIKYLIHMFEFLNMCGIQYQTPPDFAHDPINKNLKLNHEYRNARASLSVTGTPILL